MSEWNKLFPWIAVIFAFIVTMVWAVDYLVTLARHEPVDNQATGIMLIIAGGLFGGGVIGTYLTRNRNGSKNGSS